MRGSRAHAAMVAAVVVASALVALGSAPAVWADPPPDAHKLVVMDVKDAPLLELTLQMSALTGQNFVLLDRDLEDKRITIYAPEPLTVEDARDLFIGALRMHGLVVEYSGAYWNIDVI